MNKLDFEKNTSKPPSPKAQFDPDEYMQYLDGLDLTDAEAKEILSVLWDMMVQFVDLGFDAGTNAGAASEKPMLDAATMDSEKKDRTHHTDRGDDRR